MSSHAQWIEDYYLGTLPDAEERRFRNEGGEHSAVWKDEVRWLNAQTELTAGWRHVNPLGAVEADYRTIIKHVFLFVLATCGASMGCIWLWAHFGNGVPLALGSCGLTLTVGIRWWPLWYGLKRQETLPRFSFTNTLVYCIWAIGVWTAALSIVWRTVDLFVAVDHAAFVVPLLMLACCTWRSPERGIWARPFFWGRHRGYAILFYLVQAIYVTPTMIVGWGLVALAAGLPVVFGVTYGMVIAATAQLFFPVFDRHAKKYRLSGLAAIIGIIRGIAYSVLILAIIWAFGLQASFSEQLIAAGWAVVFVTSLMARRTPREIILMRKNTRWDWFVLAFQMTAFFVVDAVVISVAAWLARSGLRDAFQHQGIWLIVVAMSVVPFIDQLVLGRVLTAPLSSLVKAGALRDVLSESSGWRTAHR